MSAPISMEELKAFHGVLIYMTIMGLDRVDDYWRCGTDGGLRWPDFGRLTGMSK